MRLQLDLSEVLRYMGGDTSDEPTVKAAQQAIERLCTIAQPRYRYIPLPLDAVDFPGEDIRRHLAGCDSMYLMCATLGVTVDREIRRAERISMLSALALDAAAGDGIEKVCDFVQNQIRILEAENGRYITGRYSPGYGDLPISIQPELIKMLDAPRKIGLTLTQSGIMIPRKSVTAIIGASSVPVEGRKRGCGTCTMTATCPFRKRGTTCGA